MSTLTQKQKDMFHYVVHSHSKIWSCDIETTGLLDDLYAQGGDAKMWNFGAKQGEKEICFSRVHAALNHEACDDIRPLSELQEWLNEGWILVMHNGVDYDGEALRFFGYDLSKNDIIDTLYLAWYLEPRRVRYGLADYGEEFGVPKPKIDNWENLSQEEYNRRVMQDCRIQEKTWQKLWGMLLDLYGDAGEAWRLIGYLMVKAKHIREAARTRWKLDVPKAEELSERLHKDKEDRYNELAEVMPRMPVYKDKKRCAKPFKMSGELSSHGMKWTMFCMQYGIDFNDHTEFKYQDGTVSGNPNSPAQLKDWLFSLGWEPETYVYKRNDDGSERKIPQVNIPKSGGLLDPGVMRLIEEQPVLRRLEGFAIVKHRIGIVDGWLRDHVDGYVTARNNGLTNTLRLKHKECCNIPSDRVPYGKDLRSLLTVEDLDEEELLGSDLSSLEDRCKHHYQLPLDPDYVKSQMADDFDPHLLIASIAELVTEQEVIEFKKGLDEEKNPIGCMEKARYKEIKGEVRPKGKATNYGCQYGAGAKNLSRQAKVPLHVAEALWEAYWDANWSIREIAANTEVKKCNGEKWQRNPVNGLWYWLKAEKDRFSTLCQGTGSFVFDMWVERMFQICQERWNRNPPLCGQFHDEVILKTKIRAREIWRGVVREAINQTNELLGMRREMDCDIQFDQVYAGIH